MDSEKSVTKKVTQILGKSDRNTKKQIKKQYNKLRDEYTGEDLAYEIADRVK